MFQLLAFFSYDVIVVAKKFQSRMKVNFQGVGLLLSSHTFTKIIRFSLSFLSSTVNDISRKLYMVGTHLTVEKRAKRMPDPTVETTLILKRMPKNIG